MTFRSRLLLFLACFLSPVCLEEALPNALKEEPPAASQEGPPASYEEALRGWSTPEDINKWVRANFRYDHDRALRFSETEREGTREPVILSPGEFFEIKSGICLDLSRFCFETLANTYPESRPNYLLIQFEPVEIKGNRFRLHWMVSFRNDNGIYFFCDSHRPGYLSGPYRSVQEFVKEYEKYRARKVVRFKELDTYQRKTRENILFLSNAPGRNSEKSKEGRNERWQIPCGREESDSTIKGKERVSGLVAQ